MKHQFVEYIPETPEPGTLYISLEYNIVVHKCACGCGVDVVTPLSPAEWALTYDGATVSLWPSIGNWSFACKSHYVIKHGQVRWAARFDPQRIRRVQQSDSEARAQHYGGLPAPLEKKSASEELNEKLDSALAPVRKDGGWRGFLRRIFG